MSRIGRAPIPVPTGVEVQLDGNLVSVRGPKGALARHIPEPIAVQQTDGVITVTRPSDSGTNRSLHGLSRSMIANMVIGVRDGFSRTLEITGVGYRAQMLGDRLVLLVGYSHPVEFTPPEGVSFTVETPTRVSVHGIDKEVVGQTAARIRATRKPEPYKGKGIRYNDEVIRRKAGKAGKAGGKKK